MFYVDVFAVYYYFIVLALFVKVALLQSILQCGWMYI